jgi:hypothetical protein
MDMHQHNTTMTWPMALKGVLCVFGGWRTDYATLEDGLFDPEVEVVWVFTEDDIVPPYAGRAQPYINIDGSWPMEQVVDEILARVQRKAAFRGAVSFSEEEIPLANMLNDHLSDGRPGAWANRRQVDKFEFYTVLKAAQVPMVRFDAWSTWDELAAFVAQGYTQGAYVLKPTNASESAGVYRSLPGESVRDSFANFQSCCAQAARLGHRLLRWGQTYLIMEYIEWDGVPVEITSDVLVRGGQVEVLVVHEKKKTAAYAPFYDQIMVAPPVSPTIASRMAEIREVTQQVIDALGFRQGAVHMECRLTRDLCIPIDCALRPGGGYIPHAVYQLSGVDLRLAHVASHLADLPEPRGGTDGAGGTCIGALYTTLIPSLEVRARLVSAMAGHPAIFALAASEAFIADPQFTADATLSLGVSAQTPEGALRLFNEFTALPGGESGPGAAATLPAAHHQAEGGTDE